MRICRIVMTLLVGLAATLVSPLPQCSAQDSPELIWQRYLSNAAALRGLKLTARLDVQRMYTREINEEDKTDLQAIFALPLEDPLYAAHPQLFFKSFANFEWNVNVDSRQMAVVQKLEGAYANLSAANPYLFKENNEILRELKSLSDVVQKFAIRNLGEKMESAVSPLLLPQDLAAWHHLYTLWYPSGALIGLPRNNSLVRLKISPTDPLVVSFSPEALDSHFMAYLARAIQTPGLTPADLVLYLTIDPKTLICRSFLIRASFDGKEETIYSVTNIAETPTDAGFALPTRSLITSNVSAEVGGQRVWNTEYYCQVRVQSLALH